MTQEYPWHRVWIVGASSGLGKKASEILASSGSEVVVSARSADVLTEMAALNEKISAVTLDITDALHAREAVAHVMTGAALPPELIILNAAVYDPMGAGNFSAEKAARMMMVNYCGLLNVLEPLIDLCKAKYKAAGGLIDTSKPDLHIALVASPAGYRGLPGGAGYGPTKAALINLAEALRPELENWGVKLSIVCPGFIKTRLTEKNDFKMPQLLEPDEAARKMLKGLAKGKWEVAFPQPFLSVLKLLRQLPDSWFFAYTRSIVRQNQKTK